MNKPLLLLLLALIGVGGWWAWNYQPAVRSTVERYIESGDLLTLEAKYNAEDLMAANSRTLLPDSHYTFLPPDLKLYPYLLLDVKYVQADRKTREGFILWDQTTGEMVLDTDPWQTTHGFEDAINAGATRNDFKILLALAKQGGSASKEELQEILLVESDTLTPWIYSAIDKHLVVPIGKEFQLHLENPNIFVTPQTKIRQSFVTKSSANNQKTIPKYSNHDIEKIAKAAFGPTFTIRNVKQVFLPIYLIHVQTPDGSTLTTPLRGFAP